MAKAMVMAMVMVIVGDVARRMENAIKTLWPSFRRYMINL